MSITEEPSPLQTEATGALEPMKPAPLRFFVVYGLLYFGLMVSVMMPSYFSLPYKIGLMAPDSKVAILGVISAIGAVVGLIAGPAAGVLSDRTRTRFGRRRPWLVMGLVLGVVGALIVALAPSAVVLVIGWVVVSLASACATAAITPAIVEHVPESQRGRVSAVVGVATQLAGVLAYSAGGLLSANLVVLFLAPLGLLAVVSVLYILVVPDDTVEVPVASIGETFRLMLFNPRTHRDFAWLWVGKVFMQLALAFLTTFQLYFVLDRLGFTPEEAGIKLALVGGIGILVTMTFAIVSGILSDRLRRRKPFIIAATLLSATGLSLLSFTDGYGLFFAAVLCILGAAGMFGANDVALAGDLVPEPENAGRWMSIYNVSNTLAAAIAPLVGALLLSIGSPTSTNYTMLFVVGALITLGAAGATMAIKGVR